jgi:putative pyruvate formate lyase activating enzyme
MLQPGQHHTMNEPFIERMTGCESCPRLCKANRIEGHGGTCRIGADIQISHIGLHFGEEPPISGKKGSGTIFFAGCNLRCVFCQNYQISQEFQQHQVLTLNPDELASEMLDLQDKGAHNINFISPTHMLFQMAEAIRTAKGKGLVIPVVYNSNGYDLVDSLKQLKGLVDIYLPDIKYLDNGLGKQYSGVPNYADIVPGVIREMLDQVGHLQMDDQGIAIRGLLVRHLVLPGMLANSHRCLEFLAGISPDVFVSIMSQYSPQYKARDYPQINRTLTKAEYEDVIDYAIDLGLENAFIQEFESQDQNLPNFEKESPFNFSQASQDTPVGTN